MTHRKSPSPGGTRGTVKKSVERDKGHYPAAASPVKGNLCRACLYHRGGLAGERPSAVCIFTGERITEGQGCEFFDYVGVTHGQY